MNRRLMVAWAERIECLHTNQAFFYVDIKPKCWLFTLGKFENAHGESAKLNYISFYNYAQNVNDGCQIWATCVVIFLSLGYLEHQ